MKRSAISQLLAITLMITLLYAFTSPAWSRPRDVNALRRLQTLKRIDRNHDKIIQPREMKMALKYHLIHKPRPFKLDSDNNPPGPLGGPGTNWENPPGPIGGPGASPNRI